VKKFMERLSPQFRVRLYWVSRELLCRAESPFDYLWRRLNGRAHLPPLHLRERTGAGPWGSFEAASAEFRAYLKLICKLQPDEKVLDIGCGCGAEALWLADYLNASGGYAGLDVDKRLITWCQEHIAAKRRNFSFTHLDVKTSAYNPDGNLSASNCSFPFQDGSFDVVFAKSLFTHLVPEDADNYLKEIARLLSPAGRCLASFYLLNDDVRQSTRERPSYPPFNFGSGHWRYAFEQAVESAVAFEESYLLDLMRNHGLTLKQGVYRGLWSGLEAGLWSQDIVLFGRG
jgi:SAM-dependent methyltransferase